MRSVGAMLLLFSVTATALAASVNVAKKDIRQSYISSLGKVYMGIKTLEYNKDICTELYPEYAQSNIRAYIAWKAQHAVFKNEFDRRYTTYLHELAKNNTKKYNQYVKIMDGKFAENKAMMRAEIKKNPAATTKALCKKYPILVNTKLNPEHFYAQDIKTVRKILPHP